jgi:bifunctional UDP-N-acetylglucosamine pyrophosphorylase/glucosamine-1-phosphate N-acetyltransferase
MSELHVVVLAAGKGTRMKSALPKVLHKAHGLPLIEHVFRAAAPLNPTSTVVIVGHQAETVRRALGPRPGLHVAVQEPQLGTGHALLQAETALKGARGTVVLLSGDVPLLRTSTLQQIVETHRQSGAAATVLTAVLDDATGYGRIVREGGKIAAIVEHKDATPAQREIREMNSGIYAFELEPLFDALRQIGSSNAQGEYYLPDLITIYRRRGLVVETVVAEHPAEVFGVNSRVELAEVAAILRHARNEGLMESGVTLMDPESTFVGFDVTIGPDTVLYPNVHLEGQTSIGSNCVIYPGVRVTDSAIEDDVVLNNGCVISESRVRTGARLGPYAHIRPQSDVGEHAHVGNFVELKKTTLGSGSKANHLAYLGDATIGAKVNVGAGTITCNYDGKTKSPTIIEDGAFIGSDTQLIAPVKIGKGAYVAAGSSITEDVPADSLAIARGKQVNKEGWVSKRKQK